MEGLQGEARQRNLKEAAAKEEDPIYGFIANMDAMNKQVWGYLCEQCAQEHLPSSCASLHAPPPMHIPHAHGRRCAPPSRQWAGRWRRAPRCSR